VPVRFDERGVKTEHDGLMRHRQTKGSATDRPHLNHRVTPRLHVRREKALVHSGDSPARELVRSAR